MGTTEQTDWGGLSSHDRWSVRRLHDVPTLAGHYDRRHSHRRHRPLLGEGAAEASATRIDSRGGATLGATLALFSCVPTSVTRGSSPASTVARTHSPIPISRWACPAR